MASLRFTLSSENVARTRDLLVCLSKFSETVQIEAGTQAVTFSALNIAQTSFAAFALDARNYFESYELDKDRSESFSCSVFNKALFSIFKVRLADARDLDTSVEKCEISVFEGDERAACRIAAKLICRHGVKKTFELTYEQATVSYATFDDSAAVNTWTINAHVLKAFSDHFGPRSENLDFFQDAGRMLLTSYKDKIARGSEILQHPMQTTIAIDRLDFDSINVEEHLHVGINVKDFKAIVTHAETLKTNITARYSTPKQPMRLAYSDSGLRCEFTLLTMNEYLGTAIKTLGPAPVSGPAGPSSVQPALGLARNPQDRGVSAASNQMPAPLLRESMRSSRSLHSAPVSRPSPPPPQASINQESLFLADDDEEEEARWGERNYEEDNDAVTWDTGDLLGRTTLSRNRDGRGSAQVSAEVNEPNVVPPTQRFSQIRGLFDD